MLSIAEPKVVFCDVEIYCLVHECLQELECDASVFTFGGTADESVSAEELFEETPDENTFSYVAFFSVVLFGLQSSFNNFIIAILLLIAL